MPKHTNSTKDINQLHTKFCIIALMIGKMTITYNNKTVVHHKYVHSLVRGHAFCTFNTREFTHKHVVDILEFGTKFVDCTQVVMICLIISSNYRFGQTYL